MIFKKYKYEFFQSILRSVFKTENGENGESIIIVVGPMLDLQDLSAALGPTQ